MVRITLTIFICALCTSPIEKESVSIKDFEACTFERRLEHRRRFEGEEEFLSIFAERSALLGGHDELANETRPVPDVVILVVLGQVENILSQQLGL